MDVRGFWEDIGRERGTAFSVSPFATSASAEAWSRRYLRRKTMHLVSRHAPSPLGLTMDLGCGFGDLSADFARRSHVIVAVDFSSGMVEQTANRLGRTGNPNWQVEHADIRELGAFADADLIHLGAVCMYLEDDELLDLYRQLRARLSRRGVIIQRELVVFQLGRERMVRRGNYTSKRRRLGRYLAAARQAGLALIEYQRSPALYAEGLVSDLLGPKRPGLRKLLEPAAHTVCRLATLSWTTCATLFVLRPA